MWGLATGCLRTFALTDCFARSLARPKFGGGRQFAWRGTETVGKPASIRTRRGPLRGVDPDMLFPPDT